MEDKVLWGPGEGFLINGASSIYTFTLPDAQLVGGFVYRLGRPTMKQAIMIGEHGVLTVNDERGQTWIKIPIRKVPMDSDTFMTKVDNVKPMHYISPHRLREIKGWTGRIEFIDFPTTGWSASDAPITSEKRWSEFPGEVRLRLGVCGHPTW